MSRHLRGRVGQNGHLTVDGRLAGPYLLRAIRVLLRRAQSAIIQSRGSLGKMLFIELDCLYLVGIAFILPIPYLALGEFRCLEMDS